MPGESNGSSKGIVVDRVLLWFAGVAFTTWAGIILFVYQDVRGLLTVSAALKGRVTALEKEVRDHEEASKDGYSRIRRLEQEIARMNGRQGK